MTNSRIDIDAPTLRFFSDIGWTTGEVARFIGCAEVTIRKWSRAFEVKFPFRPTAIRRFHKSYEIVSESGCWIWTSTIRSESAPYGVLVDEGVMKAAHRFSYENYKGAIPAGMFVCHRCDIPQCVNPDHLFLGTPQDNARDKVDKGRCNLPRGQRHHWAVVTDEEADAIRSPNLTTADAARIFGISYHGAYKIRKGTRHAR